MNDKNQVGDADYELAAREFVERYSQWSRGSDAVGNLPSLVSTFEETRRIQQALERASS
jgi:hypothetical protein